MRIHRYYFNLETTKERYDCFGYEQKGYRAFSYILSQIYGLRVKTIQKLCFFYGLGRNCPASFLNKREKMYRAIQKLLSMNNSMIGHALYMSQYYKIQKLILLKVYRGIRHSLHFPTRGQRTRTNASKKNTLKNKKNTLATYVQDF